MRNIVIERLQSFGCEGQTSSIKKIYTLDEMSQRYIDGI